MAVKARLDGHIFDLDTLARLFKDGDPAIGKDAEGYYLASSSLDSLSQDVSRLNDEASSLLRKANGTARAQDTSFQPVRLIGRFSDGTNTHHVVVVAHTAHARAHVYPPTVVGGGVVSKPPSLGPKYAQAAKNHPDVADALDILGKDLEHLSWDDLHKVFEIIRENVGGPNERSATPVLIAKNWLSQTEIRAFLNSANTKAISGDAARHARGHAKTSDAMTIQEGRAAINTLVRCWLDSLV